MTNYGRTRRVYLRFAIIRRESIDLRVWISTLIWPERTPE